jgi:hypothetical protein
MPAPTPEQFRAIIREYLNEKLDEWFILVPYIPEVAAEQPMAVEIIAFLEWIKEDFEYVK